MYGPKSEAQLDYWIDNINQSIDYHKDRLADLKSTYKALDANGGFDHPYGRDLRNRRLYEINEGINMIYLNQKRLDNLIDNYK